MHNGIVDGVRRISNSEIKTFKRCRRQWWLAWYRGLRWNYEAPVEKKHNGDRVHRALAPYYVPDDVQRIDPRDALETAIQEDRDGLRAQLTASGVEPEESPEWSKLVKLNDLERIMVEGYMEWLAETGADENLEIVAAETYLEAPLPGYERMDIRLVGKIDVRAYMRSSGERVFIDHKTADVMPRLDDLERNEQMQHYELLEELTPGEEHCTGAIYNVLRRVKRTARATPPFYDRHLITHNTARRASFFSRVLGTVETIRDVELDLEAGRSHHAVAFPNETRDCHWQCPFSTICTMFDDGSRVEALVDRYYVAGDPLHYYGDIIEKTRTGEA